MNGIPVTIVGNLTREPELRTSAGGRPWMTLGVAVSRFVGSGEGREERTTFVDAKVFGEQADAVAASDVTKGTRVVITGVLEVDEWTDREGNKRKTPVVLAEDVAVSLRWATVSGVTRTGRAAAGTNGRATAQPASAPVASADPFTVGDFDEEPF